MALILRILLGLLVLSLIMLFHEGGHFVAGKLLRFTIRSFNLFMGPTLLSKKGKDGVHYNLKSFPIGASVEFSGELEEDSLGESFVSTEGQERKDIEEDPGAFFNRPRWARAIVAFGGPFMNFLTAFIALVILFSFRGVVLPIQGDVPEPFHYAAQRAGLEAGDTILAINNEPIKTAYDVTAATVFARTEDFTFEVKKADGSIERLSITPNMREKGYLGFSYNAENEAAPIVVSEVNPEANGGHPVLQKGDELLKVEGVPVHDREIWGEKVTLAAKNKAEVTLLVRRNGEELSLNSLPTLGEEPLGLVLTEAKGLKHALSQAYHTPFSLIRMTFKGFGMIFRGELKANEALAGPVRFVQIVGDVVKEPGQFAEKLERLVSLFAFLSVGIGFTQLIPIPPFDGHHLLILAIEGIRRKDLSVKTKHAIATFGFFLLIFLVFLTLYFDLSHLFAR